MNINNSMVNILKLSENKVKNNCLLTSTNRVNKQGQQINHYQIRIKTLC